MATTTRTRLALGVASLYAVVGALELMSDHNAEDGAPLVETVDYALEWAFAAAMAVTAIALVTLRLAPASRWGRIATVAAATGHGMLAIGAAATAVNGRETLDALFALGSLVLVIGYVTLAVLDVRRRVQPPRAGIVLALGFVAATITDGLGIGGGFMLAASWAAVAQLGTRTPAPKHHDHNPTGAAAPKTRQHLPT